MGKKKKNEENKTLSILRGKGVDEISLQLLVGGLQEELKEELKRNEIMLKTNRELKEKLEQQRADQADVFYHLHQKLDRTSNSVVILDQERETLRTETKQKAERLQEQIERQKKTFTDEKSRLQRKIDTLENDLMEFKEFYRTKAEYEAKIVSLNQQLEKVHESHRREIADIELQRVQEKERLKKDMLVKIKETKTNLLTMTENQLDTTTKRTILENEHMATELQYQSKEIEKMLKHMERLTKENVDLKQNLQLVNDQSNQTVKKLQFYTSLCKQLAHASIPTSYTTDNLPPNDAPMTEIRAPTNSPRKSKFEENISKTVSDLKNESKELKSLLNETSVLLQGLLESEFIEINHRQILKEALAHLLAYSTGAIPKNAHTDKEIRRDKKVPIPPPKRYNVNSKKVYTQVREWGHP